ncbi:thiol-disulfide oxidoreductase DCC family protein [Psychroflexus sp. MBR-150]|jgi:predicted DCC family thiol-disulfide oxidoreductase YuxK
MSIRNEPIILFDSVCNLCNTTVQYIIKHDKNNHFYFAPLQGKTAHELIDKYEKDSLQPDSIALVTKGKTYWKSTAVLKIASKLRFPRNLVLVFFVVPTSIRNFIYDFVAKNRYKWYGKKDSCMMPTLELKERFLD